MICPALSSPWTAPTTASTPRGGARNVALEHPHGRRRESERTMPRYELSQGGSHKFWEIRLRGTAFTTRYGKIGTAGQTATKAFGSAAEAQKAYDKLVAEKVKKGYAPAEDDDHYESIEE
jgi:predicted DNA-binding WGR domain protein